MLLKKAGTAILREPTRIITDTKGHHTLRLDRQFEDCNENQEEVVLLGGLVCGPRGLRLMDRMMPTPCAYS